MINNNKELSERILSDKIASIQTRSQVNVITSVNGQTGAVTITKSTIGLGNVDNTSDINKPVSTAQQAALDLKSNIGHGHVIADITNLQSILDGKSNVGHTHAIADITNLQTTLNNKLETSLKGAANGLAELDSNGKVPLSQINDSVLGQMEYMGLWNASTNTPTLTATPAQKGHYYVVSTGGTQFSITFATGDWIVSNGTSWDKVDNTDAVSSVFGRTGNVTAQVADYASFYVRYDTASQGLTSGQQSNARANINAQVAGSYAAASHTHTIANITGLQTALDGKEPVFSKNTAFNKNFGTAAGTVAEGNDSRINNGQTAFGWGNHALAGYQPSSTAITTSNIGSQSVTYSVYTGYVDSADTRNVVTTPESHNKRIRFDFKANSTNGLSDGGLYNGVMYWRKYGSSTDWTGGGALELAYTDNGNMWHRYGGNTSWGAWRKLWNSNDFTSTNINNWNSAYGWGNHAGLYRPISYVPSWSEITGKPSTFTPSAHTHTTSDITNLSSYTGFDSRYYTETEVNSLLSGKANTSHTHAAADIVSGVIDYARLPIASTDVSNWNSVYNNAVYVTGDQNIAGIKQFTSSVGFKTAPDSESDVKISGSVRISGVPLSQTYDTQTSTTSQPVSLFIRPTESLNTANSALRIQNDSKTDNTSAYLGVGISNFNYGHTTNVAGRVYVYGLFNSAWRKNPADVGTGTSVVIGTLNQVGHSFTTSDSIVTALINGSFNQLVLHRGTATNVVNYDSAFYVANNTSGGSVTVTNYKAFNSIGAIGHSSGTVVGTVTNYYGLYLDQPTINTGSSITNKWGVYQVGNDYTNYFAGKVGIGTSTPTYDLDVNGTLRTLGLWTNSSGVTSWGASSSSNAYGIMTWGSGYASIYGTVGNALRLGAGNTQSLMFISTSGNIGIGTTSPAYTLDVNGPSIRLGTTETGNVSMLVGSNDTHRYLQVLNENAASGVKVGGLLVSDSYTYANPDRNTLVVKGSVGVGVSTPSYTMHVAGNIGTSDNVYFTNYGNGIVGTYSATRYQSVFAMGSAYRMKLDGTGLTAGAGGNNFYGIAYTHSNMGGESKAGLAHQALFVTNGITQTAIGTGIWTNGIITAPGGNSTNWNTAYGWGNHAGLYRPISYVPSWSEITSKPSTFTPSAHTHGNITNAGAIGSTANLPLITTTSGVITTGTFGTGANTFCQGNDSRLSDARQATNTSTQLLSLGVGTAASGTTGEIRATNNITAYYSDNRLKTRISNINDALHKVNRLNGFYFIENEQAKKLGYNNNRVQVGVSAQEVEAILPEVIFDAPINANHKGLDYKTVQYDKLVPLLIEAIKELTIKVQQLENR